MTDLLDPFRKAMRLRRLAPKTQHTYLAVAQAFVAKAGAPGRRGYTRAQYVDYFLALADAGYAPAYIHLQRQALRSFARALELPPPQIESRDLPRPLRKTRETWLEPEQVEAMIRAVLTDAFDDDARCAVALATTYAMRASELRTCELDGDHLVIHIAKSGGRTLRQLVPPQVHPYVLTAPVPHASYWVEHLYHRLERAAGVARPRGSRSGFHHIRRALNTALIRAGVPEPLIQHFIRWKPQGFSGPLHYLRGGQDDFDREVFRRHPFLRCWTDSQAPPARAPSEMPVLPPKVGGRPAVKPRSGVNGQPRQKRPVSAPPARRNTPPKRARAS